MSVIIVQHQIPYSQCRRRTGRSHQRDERGELIPKGVPNEMVTDQQGTKACILDLARFGYPGLLCVVQCLPRPHLQTTRPLGRKRAGGL